ncbi:hypothetical protein J8247_03995 [Corynebacterium tuberculostearicum]|nr:hypothetical protein J8247_03995 [Corynebacterium tuberculostearicum]WKE60793.1 hypothetical protein KAH61_11600 [Corynebacterium tuberculostearicum]
MVPRGRRVVHPCPQ